MVGLSYLYQTLEPLINRVWLHPDNYEVSVTYVACLLGSWSLCRAWCRPNTQTLTMMVTHQS
jgi:hypothetical protein